MHQFTVNLDYQSSYVIKQQTQQHYAKDSIFNMQWAQLLHSVSFPKVT